MKTKWILSLLCSVPLSLWAQDRDSLQPRVLEEIIFTGVMPESDTLQNFYRANASASTENILARMSGVTLIRRGAFGQEPVFRAMQGGQLNVTLDGMRIFGACTDRMDPVTIYVEPQNLSAIQVAAGTAGAEFGSTFGGALNMKLAGPVIQDKALAGQVGVDFQSGATAVNLFSHVNMSAARSAWRVSATYRKSNNYRAGGGIEVPHSQYAKVNVAAAGKWTLGKHDTLRADVLLDRGDNIGFPALPMDVARASASIFSVTWHRVARWHFLHHLRAKAYHNNINHAMDDSQRAGILMPMDMPGSSQTNGIFAEGDVSLFRGHNTRAKLEYFANRLLGEMTMYPQEGPPMYMQTAPLSARQQAAIFVSQHLRFNDRTKAEISFRGDLANDNLRSGIGLQQWTVFYPAISSRSLNLAGTASMHYIWKPRQNIKVELQTGYGQRMPTLNERYGYYLFNRFDGHDYLGNPYLRNEAAWNTEGTLHYFGTHIEWQINPFRQRIYQYIAGRVREELQTMTPGASNVKQYGNEPHADLHGMDAMLLARPLAAVQTIFTVKYTRGRSSTGEPLPLIPPLKAVTSLRYDLRKLHLQAEWEWAAAQDRAATSVAEQPTPSWNTVALRTGWKINSFLRWNAGVENLFNLRYREHLDWGGIPRQGRNFYFNAICTF